MNEPAMNPSEGGRLPASLRGWLAARLTRRSTVAPANGKKAVIFKLDRLGDFVLALGAIRLLVRHYGEEECVLLISPHAAELAAAEFPRTQRLVLPAEGSGVLREWWPLRRGHRAFFDGTGYGTLVNLRHWLSPHHRVVLAWIKARAACTLGRLPENGADPFAGGHELAAEYPREPAGPLSRELLAHQRVVSAALGRPVGAEEVRPSFASVTPARGDYLLVCPFSSAALRDYPAEQLAAALREFLADADCRVVFSGTAAQRPALARLAARVGAPRTELSADATTLGFVQRVAGARGVLTGESAAAHIATALDKPAVILLGGGHAGMFGPWGDGRRQRWLTHPLPCFGCDWRCIFPETRCLTQIEPARVAQALRETFAAG